MKKVILILGLIILLVFLTACSPQEPAKPEAQKNLVCEKPYSIVDGDCCLDENINNVCDKDEVAKKPGADLQPGPTVSEKCEGGSKLQCIGYTIGLDTISVKLQSSSKDLINVKKMTLTSLGCSQDFVSTADLRFDEMQEFKIPCTIKHTTVDSDLVIIADTKLVKFKNSGEIYDISEPSEIQMTGHISGAVKI